MLQVSYYNQIRFYIIKSELMMFSNIRFHENIHILILIIKVQSKAVTLRKNGKAKIGIQENKKG